MRPLLAALVVLALLGSAALWGWALYAPKEPAGLPEYLQGTFVVYHVEPEEGLVLQHDFLPAGQTQTYTFRGDGSYLFAVQVSGGYEMARQEGVARVDEDGLLTLHRRSFNRRPQPDEPVSYRPRRGQDDGGEFLALVRPFRPGTDGNPPTGGYTLYLRPRSEP